MVPRLIPAASLMVKTSPIITSTIPVDSTSPNAAKDTTAQATTNPDDNTISRLPNLAKECLDPRANLFIQVYEIYE